MAKDVFSVPVFLVVFRETLETVIIVSILLAFLKQTLDGPNADRTTYKKLRRQVNKKPEEDDAQSLEPFELTHQLTRSGLALPQASCSV